MQGKPGGFAGAMQHFGGKAGGSAAGIGGPLAGAAQVNHRCQAKAIHSSEITLARLAMLGRAPEQVRAHPAAIVAVITAVIAEVVTAFERENAGLVHRTELAGCAGGGKPLAQSPILHQTA